MDYINDIVQEKSCGAVVFYDAPGGRLYLIEEMRGGHFAMPKGHVEAGETEAETAEREIREETGLSVSVETSVQAEELRSISWLPYEEALQRLSYENDREILRQAEGWLNRPQKF